MDENIITERSHTKENIIILCGSTPLSHSKAIILSTTLKKC
jgi:hypothetical protein